MKICVRAYPPTPLQAAQLFVEDHLPAVAALAEAAAGTLVLGLAGWLFWPLASFAGREPRPDEMWAMALAVACLAAAFDYRRWRQL